VEDYRACKIHMGDRLKRKERKKTRKEEKHYKSFFDLI
jgi:hypothetical protein